MSPRSPLPVLTFLTAGFLGVTGLQAQQQLQDAPPPNLPQMLKDLQGMATKQAAQAQAAKLAAAQTISAAAGAGDGGASFWQQAIKSTQMEGSGHEGSEFRNWKETDGEVFKDKEVQNAIHLHLEWLALTLQHSAGATAKDLLPAVQNYVRELWADQVTMIMIEETMKKEKEAAPAGAGGRVRGNSPAAKVVNDDRKIREIHDQILHKNVANGLISNWMNLRDYLAGGEGWENVPGSLDGIYQSIIQPELRAQKDSRVFEYWDTKMKVESETASRTKLTFEIEKYNSETAPNLLFGRAQEYIALGLKNRAATEMYGIIQKYPNHPKAGEWIAALQSMLAPPSTTTGSATPVAPAPAPVAIAPAPAPAPVALPPAPTVPPPAPSAGVSASTLALPGATAPAAPGALPGQ